MQDGSHIKGLLINFIHHNWPELLRLPFLEEFITPIVKATKGNEVVKWLCACFLYFLLTYFIDQVRSFFSLPEFAEWKLSTDNWHTWRIKYYKGLGTSTSKEAKEYFTDMARHRIKFKHGSDQVRIFRNKYVSESYWILKFVHRHRMTMQSPWHLVKKLSSNVRIG